MGADRGVRTTIASRGPQGGVGRYWGAPSISGCAAWPNLLTYMRGVDLWLRTRLCQRRQESALCQETRTLLKPAKRLGQPSWLVSGPIHMARQGRGTNKVGRSEGEPRFIQIPYWVMETPAFLALSSHTKVALLFMVKRFNGRNNGKIAFGVRSGCFVPVQGRNELQNKPVLSSAQMGRSLKEAEAAGFIACERESMFTGRKGTTGQGMVREWRLTWLPTDEKLPTKDFTRLTGGTVGGRIVPRAGQDQVEEGPNVAQQSHGRDTSSNHPSGDSERGAA